MSTLGEPESFNDEKLRHLAGLPHLEQLDLATQPIYGPGLKYIGTCPGRCEK